jgi:hypothetical protein
MTAVAGQNVISHVRCQLTSINGSVYFQGFDIYEVTAREFHITAKALYKEWSIKLDLPVLWTLDTTALIKTPTAGKYILNFYNSTQLIKSDTVQVN